MNYRSVCGDLTDDAALVEMNFLGTGSAFCVNAAGGNWQSNVLLRVTNSEGFTKSLLIDCGGDVRHAMGEQGLTHRDVDAVYVSHPHADHVGGLEWLAFLGMFDPGYEPPAIVANSRTLRTVWDHCISGGLRSIEGKEVVLESFFQSYYLAPNQGFIFNGCKIDLVNVVHIMDGNEIVPTYGLMIHMPDGQKVFFTTDTQHSPKQIGHFYDQADVIFHDCEASYAKHEDGTPNLDVPFMSGVHAHFEELKQLPDEVKAKMWLYHYQDGTMPTGDPREWTAEDDTPQMRRAAEFGFLGFQPKGRSWIWGSKA